MFYCIRDDANNNCFMVNGKSTLTCNTWPWILTLEQDTVQMFELDHIHRNNKPENRTTFVLPFLNI